MLLVASIAARVRNIKAGCTTSSIMRLRGNNRDLDGRRERNKVLARVRPRLPQWKAAARWCRRLVPGEAGIAAPRVNLGQNEQIIRYWEPVTLRN
jgi:hypothetical protein